MNERIILNMVQPYLKENKLTYDEFDKIFNMLSLREQYSVVEILNQNEIELKDLSEEISISEEVSLELEENFEILYADEVFCNDFQDEKEDYTKDEEQKAREEFLKVRKSISMTNETLIRLIQNGNLQAKQDLCIKNRGLVDKCAKGYMKVAGNKLDFEDLEQSGMLGMLKAAERFNFDLGTSFSTYATWWIKQAINREILDTGFTIRIPVHRMEQILKICYLESKYMSVENYYDRISMIAEETGYSIDLIEDNLRLYTQFLRSISIDVPVSEDEETSLMDLIPNIDEVTLEDIVIQHLCKEEIDGVLDTLTEKEKKILKMRFGLDDGKYMTLEEVEKNMGLHVKE